MRASDTPDELASFPSSNKKNDGQAGLHNLSDKELAEIFTLHQKWLDSQGKTGSKADLRCTDLAKADLSHLDLSDAQLQNACLLSADLSCSKFLNANLSGADLRGSNLKEAVFSGASLKNAVIFDADYLGMEFAGSDLTGAKLSAGNQDFSPLASVEEISINARRIFFVLLLACVYCWLTIATTADVKLITNSITSRLPIIETEMSIVPFYFSAPLVLLIVYIYFHIYLHRLWKALAMLPARFPDGRTLDEQAYPWLVNAIVRRHYSILAKDKTLLSRLEILGTVIIAWWAVPFSLMGFWVRYLPRHDWTGTGFHIGFLAASIMLAFIFYISAENTISRSNAAPIKGRILKFNRTLRYSIWTGICVVSMIILSFGAINGVKSKKMDLTDFRVIVPHFFSLFGYDVFADLRETDVSTKPEDFWRIKNGEDRINSVSGAFLKKTDLRYADMFRAFLAKAVLRNADLEGARLRKAIFQNSDIRGANLDKTDLRGANLKGTDLREATLIDADLTGAQLQDANLGLTHFHGADLNKANLENADIRCANLIGAKNLTVEQLAMANTLYHAEMDPNLFNQVKEKIPHLLKTPAVQWVEPNQIKKCP